MSKRTAFVILRMAMLVVAASHHMEQLESYNHEERRVCYHYESTERRRSNGRYPIERRLVTIGE